MAPTATKGLNPANVDQAVAYVNPTATHVTTKQWADALLTMLGAPINASNENNILTWLAHEQDASSWTSGAKGESALQIESNPLGVGGAANRPATIFDGLTQTAEALLSPANAKYGYPLIVASLQNNAVGGIRPSIAPTQAFASAVATSGWENGTNSSYGGTASSFLSLSPLVAGTLARETKAGNKAGIKNATANVATVKKNLASRT